ncbi:hypothetical protein [Diaphorobacter sp. LR2014-1]|jgi:hypothetical protein|uniref:hypothetical protein n=1 Tax=Diaphorobacter sp. LR2014-1 TaxID=1933219 RepID=UPI000CDB8598|nr:hypothetical protein [Diaphorobacter sp. LR2014-1]POR12978.1 hypothetical protein BV908_01800 [Diaphorobacter sp. LR2014-1]
MTPLPAHATAPRRLRWSALLLAGFLAACAVPEWQKAGTPRADIERTMGAPTLTVMLPEGGERLVYSRQPAGQQVYHLDFDARQRLVRVEQVLTLEHFHALRNGVDTRAAVRRTFGPPALVEKVARFNGDIWTYRFRDNGEPRQAHVHIDPAGVVQRVMFTDERLNDNDPFH